MVPKPPLNELTLYARSDAEAGGFVALADISILTSSATPVRLIGGLMVALHVQRWQLPRIFERFTVDADIGVPPTSRQVRGLALQTCFPRLQQDDRVSL
jgi:hypothetical protein